ncbi:MAG: hypothetical protein KME31_27095 [Tolypothrix carrinoi HA7290-LM1]|jgi:hypothetical protein|nr:hypothetical protein [Tolypothrix carrinoi HA7290-LM1]
MDANQRKYKGQVEINDLIGDAVKNAVFRRHQVIDSEDALSALSNEEAGSIAGGITKANEPISLGIIACEPPIICGKFPIPKNPIASI